MAAVVAGGAFLGFVLSLELWLNNRAGMKSGRAVDFIDLTIPPFGRAMMWALMVPLISLLRTRGPLGAGRVGGGVGSAFAMSFVVMATYSLGRMLAYGLFFGERFKEFRPAALSSFYGRNIIDLAYDWAVLAFGYSLEIDHRWKNEEPRSAQLEARLIETGRRARREQLRPHFLFSTMNTIAVLVREGTNDAGVTLIARLSSLLRMSLDNTRVHEVTRRQAMDFIELSIDIPRVRFPDRLQVELAIKPGAMKARIPNLILKTLVESATAPRGRRRASGFRIPANGPRKVTARTAIFRCAARGATASPCKSFLPAEHENHRRLPVVPGFAAPYPRHQGRR